MSWISIGAAATQLTIKGVTAGVKQHRANKARKALDQESPQRRAFMNDVSQMRKAYQMGTAYGDQTNELKSQQATTNEGIIGVTGGNVGSAVEGLTRAGRLTQGAYTDLVAKGDKTMMDLFNTEGAYANAQAQKKEDLNMMDYGQNKAESAEAFKSMESGLNQAIGSGKLGGIGDLFAKKKNAQGVEEGNGLFGNQTGGDMGGGGTSV